MASSSSSSSSSRSTLLEIVVISAEDLRVGRHGRRPVEKNAFVTVRTGPRGAAAAATAPDRDGGSRPEWNERLLVELPSSARSIRVDVGCRTTQGGEGFVAAAVVPVAEFSRGPAGYLHFLSYRLRDGEGRRNGIVNFSVRRVAKRGGGGRGGGDRDLDLDLDHDHYPAGCCCYDHEEAGVAMGYPVVSSCGGTCGS